MTEASINLRFSQFMECSRDFITEAQAWTIFKRATAYSPSRVLITNPKTALRTHIEKLLRPCDADLFNGMLTSERIVQNHKFLVISRHDSEWAMINEIAADAQEFTDHFGFVPSQGYQTYAKYGMHLMGKAYSLSKFKYYKNKIFDMQAAKELIHNDPDPQMTEKVYKYFLRLANIRDNSAYKNKYVTNFIYICDAIREVEIRYDKYIEVQFEYWKGFNKMPEPSWMHTREAIDRTLKLKK